MIWKAGLFLVCLSAVACGKETGRPTARYPLDDERVVLERAARLALSGNHLDASRYLEALLARGGDESRILPLLVASQVRAGRLLAALDSTRRLRQIYPSDPEAKRLHALLEELTGVRRPLGREAVR